MKLEDQCFLTKPSKTFKHECLVIICELAEGNLYSYIKHYNGHIPEATIMHLFSQILLGVHFLHTHMIDHRDLKP